MRSTCVHNIFLLIVTVMYVHIHNHTKSVSVCLWVDIYMCADVFSCTQSIWCTWRLSGFPSFVSASNALCVLPHPTLFCHCQICLWKVRHQRHPNMCIQLLHVKLNTLSVLCTESSVLCYVLYCALDTLQVCCMCVMYSYCIVQTLSFSKTTLSEVFTLSITSFISKMLVNCCES